jgi:hypothetical protein
MSNMPPNATSYEAQGSVQGSASESTASWCFGRESVIAAIEAVKRGELIVVVDDENRENEGDLIMAAQLATKESIAFMVSFIALNIIFISNRFSHLFWPMSKWRPKCFAVLLPSF